MKKRFVLPFIALVGTACSDDSTSISDKAFVEKMKVLETKIIGGNQQANQQMQDNMAECSAKVAPSLTMEEKETLLHFNGMLAKALSDQSAMQAFRNQDKAKLAHFKTVDKSYRNKLVNCLTGK